MNKRLIINSIFFLLLALSNQLASHIPQGYKKIECSIAPINRTATPQPFPHIPGPKSTKPKTTQYQESSINWCGYAAVNDLNNPAKNSVSEVSGSWIVPTIKPSVKNSYSAIWVGIDGYRSSTVEQIGTSHNFINGAVQHYAWFEMYPRKSYIIKGFPLSPGDVISGLVRYSGNDIFTLTIYNETKKVAFTVPTQYTQTKKAERKSAEWIVEAPWLNRVLPLSNFEIAYLHGCMATINGISALLNNNAWPKVSLEMVTRKGAIKATPSSPVKANGSFFVTWKHQ